MNKLEISLPLSEQLANIIRKSIISGELKSGEKISVSKICSMLDVSATPVKEAFKILQVEGLLQTKPRSGTIVSDLAVTSITNTAIIRSALEGAAVNIATRCASDEELDELERLLDFCDEAIARGDIDFLVASNTKFHRKIREIAKNQYLYTLIEQLLSYDLSVRESTLVCFEERKRGSIEHREIVKTMKERKPDEAEKKMIAHIRSTANKVVHIRKENRTEEI